RIGARHRRNALFVEPGRQVGPRSVMRRMPGDTFDDCAGDASARILRRRSRDAVVADHRKGKRQDLSRVRRIRQRLFITCHSGVKHGLTEREAFVFQALAVEACTVGKKERGAFHRALRAKTRPSCITMVPPTIVARTRRGSFLPANSVRLPFEWNVAGSTIQSRSANIVTSAGAPTASDPPGIPRMRAGFDESIAT